MKALLIIMLIIATAMVAAETSIVPTLITTGEEVKIIIGPVVNASNPSQNYTARICSISIYNSSQEAAVISNANMQNMTGRHNYTYTSTTPGTFMFDIYCVAGTDVGRDSGFFTVGTSEDDQLASVIANQNTHSNQLTRIETGVSDNASAIRTNVTGSLVYQSSLIQTNTTASVVSIWGK